jgi:FixJ family two-component response regulator
MRGPKPAYPIALTDQETEQLEHLIRAHTTPQALAMRARLIVRAHAHPEESNQQIARAVGISDRTVRTWRARWVKTHWLADAPRRGAPRRFSPSGASPSQRSGL